MTNTRIIQIWCWWLLGLIQNINSNSSQAQFMSFCNQSLNLPSLSPSIVYQPSLYSSCCNITLVKLLSLSNSSEEVTVNILNMSQMHPSFQIYNKQRELIKFFNYLSSNRTYLKSDIINLPITFSLCQFDIQPFEILIVNISKGPCKSNQYVCLTTNQDKWCIDETYHCDGYHSCPQGMDEYGCEKSNGRSPSQKKTRTIRGGIVTTIIVFGLLLIIVSVGIAIAFVYFQRKRQKRRQFTYSLESTSDDWEPFSAGYHLFDNWTNNRRHTENNMDTLIIDANEHMPIATNMTVR
ncbi:unnamed protein product [Rotaria magnacalcarata]|uniref:Uncharacterized protein n=2 Tax=Rotaria magnacalcarata TaxID=392030 RepID=A0A816LCN2_9BILA|nr:unnamed protein product [Rotaria magnacalcarata]CAF1433342.1 unnamed protein product [Rotaria magnacalcarata]CAF1946095.1 unnamed protein product [Rotaria magnacalcarata]CAF2095794.1 unnamed protein product [Rotaria magnacalcarata]CAF3738620.1 unnamed protein product [Rotaria magnacalcarata]